MGLAERHAYRTGYLKSEHWQNLRIKKLAEVDACCHFCNRRELSNDIHHIHYPEDIYKTRTVFLKVLCRTHHSRLHEVMDEVTATLQGKMLGNTKVGHDLELFKVCARVIEKEMGEQKITRYTKDGTRFRNEQHLARIIKEAPKSLVEQVKRIEKQISLLKELEIKNTSSDLEKKKADAVSSLALLSEGLKAHMDSTYAHYQAQYVHMETAG